MSSLHTNQYFNFIAMLFVAVMLFTNGGTRQAISLHEPVAGNQALVIKSLSTCQQAKTTQAQQSRFCQSFYSGYAILSNIIQIFHSLTGKLYFLFLLGMLALSHHRRLFKPPKLFICA